MDLLTTAPGIFQAYFRENRLRAPGTGDLDDDAALALHLLTFLGNYQQHEGYWPDRDLHKTMRNTCHALDALHLLNLPAPSQETMAGGSAWLVNLSSDDAPNGNGEEMDSPRWHPSRFKTLTWLAAFDDAAVQGDFQRLAQHVDRSGYLRNVLHRHLLATLIFLDTLFYLGQNRTLPDLWRQAQDRALGAIRRELAIWRENPSTAEAFVSAQELSYALDVLLAYGELSLPDVMAEEIRRSLVAELDTNDESELLKEEALYCCIQLSRHFGQHPDTQRLLGRLRTVLLRGYQSGSQGVAMQEFPFHALVLRLLVSHHDARLSSAIFNQLIRTYTDQSRSVQQARDAEIKTDLRQLLKQYLVLVDIKGLQELGGGMKAEKVYAVEFEVALSLPDERQDAAPVWSEVQKLVLKTAPYEDLQRSIDQYHSLPPALRSLFAAQAHEPYMVETSHGKTGYLIMQDLLHMPTLAAVLDDLDAPKLTTPQERSLAFVVSRVAEALHRIHREELIVGDDYAGDQIFRLYLAPLEEKIIQLGQRFPRLKPELRGLKFNGHGFRSLQHYMDALQSRANRLNPTCLCRVHGDCHSRNIMVDRQSGRVMFIDLDRSSRSGDYIDDFALLLEDVCVYRYLSDGKGHSVLRAGDVAHGAGADAGAGWRFTRSLLPEPFAQRFQSALLGHLPNYALTMHGDDNWRPRLWLATAVRLVGLATLVPEEQTAVVLFAEAVRLLDTLHRYLARNEPLPQLLFGVSGPAVPDSSHSEREARLLRLLQETFPALTIRPAGQRYEFRTADGQLGAVLMAVERVWRLMLTTAPELLRQVAPEVRPHRSGALQSRVDLPPDPDGALALAAACLRVTLG